MSKKVLIVDDEKEIRYLLEIYLKNKNYIIKTVGRSDNFMSHVEKFEPDIILLDIKMPIKDGFQCYEELKQQYKKIPILFISGTLDQDVVSRVITQDIVFFVNKPFDLSDIAHKIDFTLKNYPKGVDDHELAVKLVKSIQEVK